MQQAAALPAYDLYIGGRWVPPRNKDRFPTYNPFTQQAWAEIAQADADEVAMAIQSARDTFEKVWKHKTGLERATLMFKLADLVDASAERIGKMETTDNGKVIRETSGQARYLARVLRFYAGYADKLWGKVIPLDRADVLDYAAMVPLGVIGLITAWNSPMSLLGNKLAACLAAGNCVVVKPSEHASVTTLEFSKLMEQAGFPAGVFNVVTGDARTGAALAGAAGLDKITFTGSANAGRAISAAASKTLTPVVMELGGKSPNIIFTDANLDKACNGAFAGIFAATGQTCIAGSRLLVQRPIYHEVVTRLTMRAPKIRLGNPLDSSTEMGTVANQPQLDRIMGFIDSAKKEGARLMTGGERATGGDLGNGLFIQPTIFADVTNGMKLAQEEIFGPVLAIIPFDTEEDAIEIGNDSRFGLASGIWTQDVNRVHRVAKALHTGLVWVNTYRAVGAQIPFGGVKESGHGRERGQEGMLEFMTTKNVMINFSEEDRDPFAIQT